MMKLPTFNRQTATPLLLRTGLSLVFGYAAISSLVNPNDWIGYLPSILTTHISAIFLLHVFAVYELLLALALLSGIYVRYVALLCALTFGGIVLSNLSLLTIVFRDVGLFFSALALAFMREE